MSSEFYRFTVTVEEMTTGWAVQVDDEDMPMTLTGRTLELLCTMAGVGVAGAVQEATRLRRAA